MSEYIKREDVYERLVAHLPKHQERIEQILNDVPSIELDDDSIILSPEAYSHLCLSAAGRQKASKHNTCGTCKWRCGRKTSVGIECMQPDNQKKWQAKDTPHHECIARYKTAGTTCKRYERKDQEDE